MSGWDPAASALLALLPQTGRGPRREGIFALWLTLRVAQDLLRDPPAERAHRRRLQALEHRLTSLTLPPPLRRALAAAISQLRDGRPETAVQVLSQLVAPARETGGAEAGEAVAHAARGRESVAPARSGTRCAARERAADRSENLVARIDATDPGRHPGRHGAQRLSVARPDARRRVPAAGPRDPGRRRGERQVALALGIAIRAARAGVPTLYLSGEMGPERVMERALALEGKASVDDLRQGRLDPAIRAAVGGAAHRLRDMPLLLQPAARRGFDEVREALDIVPPRTLLVVDSLQLTPVAAARAARLEERVALAVRALKALAVERDLAVLATAQLPHLRATRPDPRPTLDDLGGLGAIKQNADLVLAIYREEMYRPGQGVEGATELIVAKNRNGPTGFVDLYFYPRWLRFEDMLDPS